MSRYTAMVLLFISLKAISLHGVWTGYEITNKYFISQETATYLQAFVYCRQGGLELVSIETPEEQAVLNNYIIKNRVYDSDKGPWTSGIRIDHTSNSSFHWLSTGDKLVYTKWAPGQPDNYDGKEHCIHWSVTETAHGYQTGFNDYLCDAKLRFICERK